MNDIRCHQHWWIVLRLEGLGGIQAPRPAVKQNDGPGLAITLGGAMTNRKTPGLAAWFIPIKMSNPKIDTTTEYNQR